MLLIENTIAILISSFVAYRITLLFLPFFLSPSVLSNSLVLRASHLNTNGTKNPITGFDKTTIYIYTVFNPSIAKFTHTNGTKTNAKNY